MKSSSSANINKILDDARVPFIGCNIQYWTLNEGQCQIPDDHLSARSYYDKEPKKQDASQKASNIRHGQYHKIKQDLVTSRGGTWIIPNKRPDHVRDSLKELEELLKSYSVLCVRWTKKNRLQLILQTGIMANILMSDDHDIIKLIIDKSLVNKTPSDAGTISAAVLTETFCLLSFSERNKLAFISYTQRPGTPDHKQISSKMSSMDMKITYHDIPGIPGRQYDRKFCVDQKEEMAICWCSTYKGPTTWTPTSTDEERANMILLSCSFGRMEMCSYVQTEYTPLSVEFSRISQFQVHTIEKSLSSRNESFLHFTVYECAQNKIQRLSVSTIPIKSGVLSSARSRAEDKVVLGCTDGTVMIYDVFTKVVRTVRDTIVPSIVLWHPNGGVIMVASGTAELRCYDTSLSPLSTLFVSDTEDGPQKSTLKLSQFLSAGNGLVSLTWQDPAAGASELDAGRDAFSCYDAALGLFDGGPLAVIKLNLGVKGKGLLRPIEIVKEYLRHGNFQQAVQVLHTLNWNTDGKQAYLSMTLILNHLLKLPLNHHREGQLEAALSAFYAPKSPLAERVVLEYRHVVSRYARRFYFHLLRFQRFEKAFLLAKDIQDHDLFVDLYFAAKEAGETHVSRAAKQQAYELQSSDSSDGGSFSDEGDDEDIRDLDERGSYIKRGKARLHGGKYGRHKALGSKVRIKRDIPASYPAPKMDDFMSSLMNEALAVVHGQPNHPSSEEQDVADVGGSSSTLKVMHLGYV